MMRPSISKFQASYSEGSVAKHPTAVMQHGQLVVIGCFSVVLLDIVTSTDVLCSRACVHCGDQGPNLRKFL